MSFSNGGYLPATTSTPSTPIFIDPGCVFPAGNLGPKTISALEQYLKRQTTQTMYGTLKQTIEALPEPERSARKAFYTDEEWENSWELNAWPHQIPPMGSNWSTWTIIGPPKTGKTSAGIRWVVDRFLYEEGDRKIVVIVPTLKECDRVYTLIKEVVARETAPFNVTYTPERKMQATFHGRTSLQVVDQATRGRFIGAQIDYIWADEAVSAPDIVVLCPTVKQYLFTQPDRLPENTIISRAGQPRVL